MPIPSLIAMAANKYSDAADISEVLCEKLELSLKRHVLELSELMDSWLHRLQPGLLSNLNGDAFALREDGSQEKHHDSSNGKRKRQHRNNTDAKTTIEQSKTTVALVTTSMRMKTTIKKQDSNRNGKQQTATQQESTATGVT